MEIDLSQYDYHLPRERIAQVPSPRREESRLLVLERSRPGVQAAHFFEIGRFLRPGDLLVLNDARVFPARLRCRRPSGGRVEVLLCSSLPGDPPRWEALVRPTRAARGVGPLTIEGAAGQVRIVTQERTQEGADEGGGRFQVEVLRAGVPLHPQAVHALCEEVGEVPLPPYIAREPGDSRRELDRERYQTVYARAPGAMAAPTAGLHFTEALLDDLRRAGIETQAVTLTVGLGTFQPLREGTLRKGRLHPEPVAISLEAGRRILAAHREGRRVVAVGTTTARALESWAMAGTPLVEGDGGDGGWRARTELFIAPGHRFALVTALVTNFHLPRSSLLCLVSTLAGRERILEAYRKALEADFRFYSYGDAMLIA